MNHDDPDFVNESARAQGVPCQRARCRQCHWRSNPRNDYDTSARVVEKLDHEENTGHVTYWVELEVVNG